MSRIKAKAVGVLLPPLLRTYGRTWRITMTGREHEDACRSGAQPLIYAFLHGRLLLGAYAYRGSGVGILVSQHRDGRMFTDVARRLGFGVYDGSSTRGGTKALLALCREDPDVPLTVTTDGPKGPEGSVKHGIVMIAQKTRRVVLPVGLAASRAWRLGSWDRLVIPKPFARVHVHIGGPIVVPDRVSRAERGDWAEVIREGLTAAEAEAWRRVS